MTTTQPPPAPPMMMASSSNQPQPAAATSNADEIIARRREQLRLLQQRSKKTTTTTNGTSNGRGVVPPPPSSAPVVGVPQPPKGAPPPPMMGMTNGTARTTAPMARRSQSAPKPRSPVSAPPMMMKAAQEAPSPMGNNSDSGGRRTAAARAATTRVTPSFPVRKPGGGVAFQQQTPSPPPSTKHHMQPTVSSLSRQKNMPVKGTPHPSKKEMTTTATTTPENDTDFDEINKKKMPTKGTPFPRGGQQQLNISTDNEMTPELKNEATTTPQSSAASAAVTSSSPIETPRRDLLNNLRQYAETPPSLAKTTTANGGNQNGSISTSSNDLRMVQQLNEAVSGKTDALRQVARLEGMLQQLQQENKKNNKSSSDTTSASASLQEILQISETNGNDAAIQYAKQQLQSSSQPQSPPLFSFGSNGSASTPPRRGMTSPLNVSKHPLQPPTKRVATPQPKHRGDAGEQQQQQQQQQHELEHLIAASKNVPYDYTSELATYIVRRPYVTSVDNNEDEEDVLLWNIVGNTSGNTYQQMVNVHESSTIEILAKINADNSILTLSDLARVRHCKRPIDIYDENSVNNVEWKVYDNVDAMNKPLGCVMYIDSDACEQEYWLDAIYEEAMVTRDAYCACLISTASGLQKAAKENPNQLQQQQKMQPQQHNMMEQRSSYPTENGGPGVGLLPPPQQQQQPPALIKPETVDASVETDPIQQEQDMNQTAQPPQEEQQHTNKQQPEDVEDDDSSAGDVLSMMIVTFFSFILGSIWSIFIELPIRIVSLCIQLLIAICIISVIWLYLSDDHGAFDMGISYNEFDPPGRIF